MKNYYKILGIESTSSMEEVKRTYRKLVFRYHPDKNGGDDFYVDLLSEIKEAYGVLGDSSKRAIYDTEVYKVQFTKLNNMKVVEEPIINYFVSEKSAIKFGEETTLKWETRFCDKVTLTHFGVVDLSGVCQFRWTDYKSKTIVLELIAVNTKSNGMIKRVLVVENETYEEMYEYFKIKLTLESDKNQYSRNHKSTDKGKRNYIAEYRTDKGLVRSEQKNRLDYPGPGKKAFLNGVKAPDGKYRFGFLWYVHIKNGIVVKLSII